MLSVLLDTYGPSRRLTRIAAGGTCITRPNIALHDAGPCVIRYRVAGTPRPTRTIVLAVDPPLAIEHYDALVARLSPHFRVVVLEAPGFGFSLPRAELDFTFHELTRLIEEFLEHLGLGPYILAFPCVAAYTAIALTKRREDLVSHLVILQAPSWQQQLCWKRGRDSRGLLSTPIVGQLALRLLLRSSTRQWIRAVWHDPHGAERAARMAIDCFERGACCCLASAFQRYLTGADPTGAGPIHQPVLAIWGTEDPSHRDTDKMSVLTYGQECTVLEFDGAGHFPELEQPARFCAAMRQFASIEPAAFRELSPSIGSAVLTAGDQADAS